tara:strand:+ start:297 stop:1964 length:1668 start_codon:yes stop_codon:yes gene_type:complete
MSNTIDIISEKWSQEVGAIDLKNPKHIAILSRMLLEMGIPFNDVQQSISILVEDNHKKVKFKDPRTGDMRTITMDTARQYASDIKQGDTNPEKEAAVKAAGLDGSEVEKEKETKPPMKIDANPFDDKEDEMGDDGEKDSEEDKPSDTDDKKPSEEQLQKEKNKMEYLTKIADLFISGNTEEKGAGRFRLSKEDVDKFKEHQNKTPEQLLEEQKVREQKRKDEIGEVNDEDTEIVLDIIKSKLDSKQWNSLKSRIKKKGDPPGEYSKGERGAQRVNSVIQHYLQTGGISSITGEPVPFSDSQLDHIISLDNGGVDGPENWEWMESRFNQFKGKRTKPEVMKALEERGLRTDEEWLLEATDDELKNFEVESSTAYWNTIFANTDEDGNPGLGNLTIEKIDNMTSSELNNLAKGWNRFVGDGNPRYIPRYGTRKTEIDGKRHAYSRGGDVKPDKNNPNTWGVKTDNYGVTWSEPQYKDDSDGYEKALADYDKSRASGGAKITTGEVREMIKVKISGIPKKSTTDEIDVMFESILGQIESDKSKIKDLKKTIKTQKAEQ